MHDIIQKECTTAKVDVEKASTGVGDVEESLKVERDVEESSKVESDVEESSRVEGNIENESGRSTSAKLKSRKRKLAQKLALRKRRKIASEDGLASLFSHAHQLCF